MTTAFAVTKISGPVPICPGLKVCTFVMQHPSASVEAGHTMDVSTYFSKVYGATFGPSGASADFGVKCDLIGTYSATGTSASAVKVVHHMAQASDGAFAIVAANTDLSSINDMVVTVWGN